MNRLKDMHPYDGLERRFRYTDRVVADGLGLVAELLRLEEAPNHGETLFDLSFFSGGIGVHDRLAIKMAATPALWTQVSKALDGKTLKEALEEGAKDTVWGDQFIHLIGLEGMGENVDDGSQRQWQGALEHEFTSKLEAVRLASVEFINHERFAFQAECHAASQLVFQSGSDVNDWVVLWGDEFQLNYLGYSQG